MLFDNKELTTEVCARWSWRQRMADKMVLEVGTGKEFGGEKKGDPSGLFFPNTLKARDRFRGTPDRLPYNFNQRQLHSM